MVESVGVGPTLEFVPNYRYTPLQNGLDDEGEQICARTKEMVQQWLAMADDGDHYRLAFDKPGTWSQKYNLVWDRLLGLNVFPPEVARKEIAFYKEQQGPYGLLYRRGISCYLNRDSSP